MMKVAGSRNDDGKVGMTAGAKRNATVIEEDANRRVRTDRWRWCTINQWLKAKVGGSAAAVRFWVG